MAISTRDERAQKQGKAFSTIEAFPLFRQVGTSDSILFRCYTILCRRVLLFNCFSYRLAKL